MSSPDDRQPFRSSPTGPRVAPPTQQSQRSPWQAQPQAANEQVADEPVVDEPMPLPSRRRTLWGVVLFLLFASGTLIPAYWDLSRPEAWSYWKDQYFTPSLKAAVIPSVSLGAGDRGRRALAVSGEIGPAAASWLREQLDEAKLGPGDLVLLSSPGGNLAQGILMGEAIRARGLDTAVGVADAAGRVKPAYCASACVLMYAGGKTRYGVEKSALGVHRFVNKAASADPVADTQRVAGMVLGYMTRMGVSSSVVEAMSQTSEIRWLPPQQALAMKLITDPVR